MDNKSSKKTTLAIMAGTIAAGLWHMVAEKGIPKETDCEYMSPWTTDLFAWIGGGLLVWQGLKHNNPLVAGIGSAVASLHLAQFAAAKTTKRISS